MTQLEIADVAEASVRLRAALDAAVVWSPASSGSFFHVPAITRSELVSPGDVAVGDGHVLRSACFPQGVTGLGTDSRHPMVS